MAGWDEAVVESFFGGLKRELLDRRSWPSRLRRRAACPMRRAIRVPDEWRHRPWPDGALKSRRLGDSRGARAGALGARVPG